MTVLPAALLLAVVAPAKDVDGDGNADWVPVRDPSVFAQGRNVRLGVSVAF
jgi:hypothetical protein